MKLNALIPFALALMLALTGQAMAVARGSADATGQMVLCVGAGTVTVYTDADGAPTTAPHFCPDCALQLAFAPQVPPAGPPERVGRATLPQRLATLCVPSARGVVPQAHAPPVAV